MNEEIFSQIIIDKNAALPRYLQVAEQLKRLISAAGLTPGSRLPSDNELVKQTGLSLFTVRQAVSELVKTGIAERLHGKGTFLKSATPEAEQILLFIDEKVVEMKFSPFYAVLFHHLVRSLDEHRIEVKKVYLDHPESIIDKAFEFRGKNYRKAVFFFSEIIDDYRMMSRLLNMPVVFIDHYVFADNTSCVVSANRCGGHHSTEYLWQTGCRKIAFMGDDIRRYNYELRGEGFMECLREHGINPETHYFRQIEPLADAVAQGNFDGVVCCSDFHTLLLLEELRLRNVEIPNQASVISYDGTSMLAGCRPEITAIRVDLKDMAEKVCDAITRKDTGFILECATELIPAKSTRS